MTAQTVEQIPKLRILYDAMRAQARWRLYRSTELAREWARADVAVLALWTPVAIGLGAGVYFGLKAEPAAWLAPVLFAAALVLTLCVSHIRAGLRPVMLAASFLALGFLAADMRTAFVAAPVLERELGIETVTGRLIAVQEGARGRRLVLALSSIDGLDTEKLPARARISWRGKGFDAKPGDFISLRAGLSPPPPPASPGTFDFARQLYFQRIGAVGFAVSAPVVLDGFEKTIMQRWAGRVEALRLGVFRRITTAAPGEGGAIVAAVVTGKRDAIAQSSKTALRDTGLAHLLAISGLHMGLATGLVFFAVRFGLAMIEPIALRYPIKKWAAAAALLSGVIYLILSGSGWSARRAFIMTAIIFAAILVDRRGLSLRNVAIAAVIILLTTPEALFHPGFQMSFAAVTSLIAGFEWHTARANPMREFTTSARMKRYAVGLAATDTLAALATAPYALYHFNRVALYSLPANMLAMPLMGFWIMPVAVIALILTPFGLDGWAWRLSALGMEVILEIATTVAAWPGSVSVTPQWPFGAMAALSAGGLWLCLSRSPWRLGGLLAIPAAVLVVATAQRPQIFVAASGLNAAMVTSAAEELTVYSKRRDKFSVRVWKEALGFDPAYAASVLMKQRGNCDDGGCVIELAARDGEGLRKISFLTNRQSLDEDCVRADLVVAFFPVSGGEWSACAAVLIDRRSVWRNGAHAIWLDGDQFRILTVSEARGARPWTGE